MALTYRTKASTAGSTSQPVTLSFTIQTGDVLLALCIMQGDDVPRTGGSPTRGAQTFVQAGSTQTGSKEASAAVWYIIDPTVGTADISVPNDTPHVLDLSAVSFYGTGAEYFGVSESNTTVADPSLTIDSVPEGSALVNAFGSGYKDLASASDNVLDTYDYAGYTTQSQYKIAPSTANQTLPWTQPSDDVANVLAAWEEVVGLTPKTAATGDANTSTDALSGHMVFRASIGDNVDA